jgi:hypothetical protein
MDVVGQPVEQGAGQALGAEHGCPLVEGEVAGDDGGAALVALGEHLEQQLGSAPSRPSLRTIGRSVKDTHEHLGGFACTRP